MAEKLATIEVISSITPHPNAERLEFAHIKGYQVITQKDLHRVGDQVVFIVPDTVLPDAPWAESFKKYAPKRVRAIKIRGEYSMGIIMPMSEMLAAYPNLTADEDIANTIGVSKYEAPVPNDLQAKGALPFGIFKTDEDRYQSYTKLPYGELVNISLKIDGQSSTYFCKKVGDDWETGITSRSLEIKPDAVNRFTRVNVKYNILEKLKAYCIEHNVSLALRGEVYGDGVQNFNKNPHAKCPLDWACFSVLNLDTLKYERVTSVHHYTTLCEKLELPIVPTVSELFPLTPDLISQYELATKHPTLELDSFEGVVMETQTQSFKVINLNYDANK